MTTPADAPARRPMSLGAAFVGGAQLATALTGWLTTLLIARLLGPDGVGAVTLALSLTLVLGMVAGLGLENGLAYLVASKRWSPVHAFRDAQLFALLLGLVAVAVAVGVRLIVPSAFKGLSVALVAVAAAGVIGLLSWQFARFIAVALDHYEVFAAPVAVASTLGLVLAAALTPLLDLEGAIIALTAGQVLTAAATAWWVRRLLPREPVVASPEPHPLRHALRFGVKSNAAQALQFLNYRVDLFILSAASTQAKVGLYSVAVSVTSVMYLAPQTLATLVFPRIAQLSTGTQDDARDAVEAKAVRHVALVTYVLVPVIALGVAVGIPLLYGGAFDDAILFGLILLPGMALFGISAVLIGILNGRGLPHYALRTALLSTPPTIALYLLVIPAAGAIGAAIASSCSYALSFALSAWYFRRATGVGVAALLVPTRADVDDYRALARRLRRR